VEVATEELAKLLLSNVKLLESRLLLQRSVQWG
jgi:hypothetical protein